MGRGTAWRVGVALAAHGAILPAPVAASPVRPACHEIVVSPSFAKDRTAFCTQVLYTTTIALSVFRTKDGGRTWSRVSATGLGWNPTSSFVTQPQLSPGYATDRRLVVATNTGLYVSTDDGTSFALVDAHMRAKNMTSPLLYEGRVGALDAVLGARRLFALNDGLPPSRADIATGAHLAAVGVTGDLTEGFVVPSAASPASPVLAMSYAKPEPSGPDTVATLWTCTDDLVCAEQRSSFPRSVIPVRFWRIALANHRSALVATAHKDTVLQTYVSTDDGVTFRRWTSLDKLIDAARRHGKRPFVSLAANPALPNLVYARIVTDLGARWDPGEVPTEQLFRSDDGGTTWRRVGYQLDYRQRGRRGNLPWNSGAYGFTEDPAAFALGPDGRLLVPAAVVGDSGQVPGSATVYCSLDGGGTWRPLCPR